MKATVSTRPTIGAANHSVRRNRCLPWLSIRDAPAARTRGDKREESRRVVGPTRDDGEDVHQHGTSGDCCESEVTNPDQLTDTHDDQWEREESAQDHLRGEEPQIV